MIALEHTNYVSLSEQNARELFKTRYRNECRRIHWFMMWLMAAQWLVGLGFACYYSPLTWSGQAFEPHIHLWAAGLLGGSISGFAILWTRQFPDQSHTRHVMAICQILWSALLIHLSGGRIETHFHVFASLAILSIYRDWKILATAAVVVAIDHFVRGVFYPFSAFGIVVESPYRWLEHLGWLSFELCFLAPGCIILRNEIYELCLRQAQLREAKSTVELRVEQRTAALTAANKLLAAKTLEAEKLALVARYTDNGVVITDDSSRIEWVNDGFERITGYAADEAIGKTCSYLLHGPKTDRREVEAIEAAIKANRGYDAELLKYRKNGEPFWMSIEARPIEDALGNTRFILIESDITERVQADLERQRLNEQLVDASRAAGVAEVATGVLHNVGNVLNSVNVSAAVIQKQFSHSAFENLKKVSDLIAEHRDDFHTFVTEDDRGRQIPQYILRVTDAMRDERDRIDAEFHDLLANIEHIKEIVAVQQEIARSSSIQQSVDIALLVDDAIVANQATLNQHQVIVDRNIQEDLPRITSDKPKIRQILINLIRNAKDSLAEFESPNPKIKISVSRWGNQIQLVIADNGMGIDRAHLDKIFQHGFTTKTAGHGFGLHSSANAAVELGGSLNASSAGLGLGASFRLLLPIQGAAQNHSPHEIQSNSLLQTKEDIA